MTLYLALLHHEYRQEPAPDPWEGQAALAYYFSLARVGEEEARA